MKKLYHPERHNISLTAVLYALGEPIRLKIVKSLAAHGEQPCGACNALIPKSTLSRHFQVLREAGIIHIRQEGTQRINSLRREDLDARFPGLLDLVLQASEPL